MEFSNKYIVGFALVVCLVCSLVVSLFAVGLGERQDANKRLDLQTNILAVAGLIEEGQHPSPAEVAKMFESISADLYDRRTGERVGPAPAGYDVAALMADAKTPGKGTPTSAVDGLEDPSRVGFLPDRLLVFHVTVPGKEGWVLPIWGNGLWSTLKGFLALEENLQRIRGITFYEHGETPGLGGEVDNPRWKAQWRGKRIFDDAGALRIEVTKAGKAADPDFQVDGISGATITSRSVNNFVRLWLGEAGYGAFLRANTGRA
ncbi:MAG: NADH:ubiquinone reductase (Na(+)-transporting) subunit C [Planctomycetota bacterium]|nr:MAG: NADH:ubiquinone reductase (Na(+)-transporting) subunit C [Planctomycetota bacterium]